MRVGQSKIRNLLNNGSAASPQESASEEEGLDRVTKKHPRPMKPDGWWKEVDNFLATDSWECDSREAKALGPTIWLQHTNEQMRLCNFQYRTVTLIMLVPVNSSVNGLDGLSLLRGQLLEKVCTWQDPGFLSSSITQNSSDEVYLSLIFLLEDYKCRPFTRIR